MKKLLILFLLAFPILIFAIINISASIIGWYIPLPVEKIEVSLDNINWSETIDLKVSELNEETNEVAVYFRVLPSNARNHQVSTYSSDEFTSEIKDENISIGQDGLGIAKVSLREYGYSEITLTTIDGNYEAIIDVSVVNPQDDPNLVKSIVFEYKERLHSNLQFGYLNNIIMDFKYFPKEANKDQVLSQISTQFEGEVVKSEIIGDGLGSFELKFANFEKVQTFTATTSENRSSHFKFNVNEGYNLKRHSLSDLNTFTKSGNSVYQLEEIDLKATLNISNGTKYYGNNYKITHKEILTGVAVNVTGNLTSLDSVHIMGPLLNEDGQIIPSSSVVNLKMSGSITAREQKLTNSVIENGRYNLVVDGKSVSDNGNYLPTVFEISNTKFIGALMAGLNIDNQKEGALMINSTHVKVSNLTFEWAGVGILMQNSQASDGQKGYSILTVFEKTQNDLVNSIDTSNNWRNLDEASGLLKEQNVLGLLDELKTYENAIKKVGKYYYVSATIMIRGGATNYSRVELDPKTYQDLIIEKRTPSTMEAMHPAVGGRFPFTVYLLNPIYYKGEITNENS